MKRVLYICLFSVFAMMIALSLYFVTIYWLVVNRIIPIRSILYFTDVSLSPTAYLIVALIGILIGYRAGKKWWQIIYVDGVYYFDKRLKPTSSEKPKTPRERRMAKKTQE